MRAYRGCLIWTIANFSNWVGQHHIQRVIQFSTGKENKLQHSWFLELEPELSVTILVSRTDFVWRVQTHCFLLKDCLKFSVYVRQSDEPFWASWRTLNFEVLCSKIVKHPISAITCAGVQTGLMFYLWLPPFCYILSHKYIHKLICIYTFKSTLESLQKGNSKLLLITWL